MGDDTPKNIGLIVLKLAEMAGERREVSTLVGGTKRQSNYSAIVCLVWRAGLKKKNLTAAL
jgi:hypothetical protein